MQEHGLLERVLLIYDESARRIEHGEQVDLAVLTSAAGIIRRFVEHSRRTNTSSSASTVSRPSSARWPISRRRSASTT
jgi:hypothetical protein